MTSTRKIPVAMLLATGLLSSCGTQSPPNAVDAGSGASSAEQAEVAHQVASRPDLVDDAVFEASVEAEVEVSAAEPGRPAPPDSLRRPRLRWWRTITGVRRSFEFAYRDTDSTGRPRLATVTVRKTLTGSFNVARRAPCRGGELISAQRRAPARQPVRDPRPAGVNGRGSPRRGAQRQRRLLCGRRDAHRARRPLSRRRLHAGRARGRDQ